MARRPVAWLALLVLALGLVPAAGPASAQAGPFSQVAILANATLGAQAGLGSSVAISADGSTIVVGAALANGATGRQGSLSVFVRPSGGWTSSTLVAATLVATDGEAGDALGTSVAISADGRVIAAGAPFTEEQGGVYVYYRPAGGWTGMQGQDAKLVPSSDQTGAEIGADVAISAAGDVVIAGAPAADSGAGAAFIWQGGGWSGPVGETAILTARDGVEGAGFGESVSISADGTAILIGAPEAVNAINTTSGAGYLFVQPGSAWISTDQFTAKLTASDPSPAVFLAGAARLSADGTTVVLTSFTLSAGRTANGYLYLRPATGWIDASENAQLSGVAGMPSTEGSVALSGDGSTVVWGLPNAGPAQSQGTASVYLRPAGGWSGLVGQTQALTASDAAAESDYGWDVALTPDGGTIVVGSPGALSGRGETYVVTGSQIAGFSPASAGPGDSVVISGANLQGVSAISFGGVPALQFTATTSQVTAVVGLGASGPIVLATPQGSLTLPGFTFVPGPSTIAFGAIAPTPSVAEQAVTIPFVVATALGPPSGTVTIQASSGESCSAPVAATSCQIVFATPGVRSLSATYDGNAFFQGSSAPPRLHVVQVGTTTTIGAPTPSLVGETVTISATVASTGGTPSGTITVRASSGELCTASAPAGICQLTFLTSGPRTLVARYGGGAGFLPSESAPIVQSVRAASETSIVGDPQPDPSIVGGSVTVSYTVVSASGTPTGTVLVTANSGESCAATVAAGGCSLVFAGAATRSLTATFGGSATFLPSASLPISHSVDVAPLLPTSITISSTVPSPSLVGRPVAVTYVVTAPAGTPTGAVLVQAATGESCAGTAPAGSCVLTFATPGARRIAASYFGDATYAADTSPAVRQTVLDVPLDGLTAGSTAPTLLGTPTELFAAADGGDTGFTWSFGTGAAAAGGVVAYTYPGVGRYSAIVMATNSSGTLTEAVTVDIVAPPQLVTTTASAGPGAAIIRFTANPGGAATQVFVDYQSAGGPPLTIHGATLAAGLWGPVTGAVTLVDLPADSTFSYRVRLASLAGTAVSPSGQFATASGRLFVPLNEIRTPS